LGFHLVGDAARSARRGRARRRAFLPSQAARAARDHVAVRSMTVLAARGIRKAYGGREVVAGIDLELRRGECYGLLGPNGAGKTTTLRLLLGLTAPDAGEITLLGHPVPRAAREGRIRVGVVPQVDNLDPDFTVRENLVVYGRYFGIARAEMERRLPELLSCAALESG